MSNYSTLDTSSLGNFKLKDPGFSELDVSSLNTKTKAPSANAANAGKMQAAAQGVEMAVNASGEGESEAGGAATGAMSGAATGMAVGGPWGAAIGGVIGGIAGGLSARSKRKAANAKIEATKISNIGKIQQQQGIQQSNILGGLANNLAKTLV